MILKPTTTLFVICKADGSSSRMSLNGYHNALIGGLNSDTVVVTTDAEEASFFEKKYKTIAEIVRVLDEVEFISTLGAVAVAVRNKIDELN